MRAKIGLFTSTENNILTINQDYLSALWQSGGLGFLLPYNLNENTLQSYTEEFDGFLFCGGGDIDPSYYGEEKSACLSNICSLRDELEFKMFKRIYRSKKPMLGICRGAQVMNVFLGGSLWQDIECHKQSLPRNVAAHSVSLSENGYLKRVTKKSTIGVNSFHHQAVKALGEGLIADAFSPDGYIEAFYAENHPFLLGIQWHPENMLGSTESKMIFSEFISACHDRKQCRTLDT